MRLVSTWCAWCLAIVIGTASVLGSVSHASAQAEATVIILGLRSVEGDDEVANALTDALRDAAHGIQGWKLSDRSVSMTQMSLAHGCDDIDANCLSEIAKGLSVDRVIYGTVRRTSARAEYDYQVALSIFDASTGAIGANETDTIPNTQSQDAEALHPRAVVLLQRLSGGNSGGLLHVQVDAGSAEVRLDGVVVGQTRDHALLLEGVAPGEHQLDVEASGYPVQSQKINVSATEQTNVSVTVIPASSVVTPSGEMPASRAVENEYDEPKSGGSLKWLGYTLLGVGGASVIGMAASWLVINGINGDATYLKYSDAVDPSIDDLCAEAKKGIPWGLTKKEVDDVASQCDKGSTFEVLQYVFLGTALVSGGVGAYILLTDKEHSQQAGARRPALALTPSFGKSSALLTAKLAF